MMRVCQFGSNDSRTTPSHSGKLVAKELQSENINSLTQDLFNTKSSVDNLNADNKQLSTNVNEIQKLLADIKNQPLPNPAYYRKLEAENIKLENKAASLTVTGNSNLYNLSVTGSTAIGNLIFEDNSILSLSWDFKLSSLGTIRLFDDAVVIAKDGTITTQGALIAQGGVQIKNSRLEIRNSAGNEVASIDASGSAQFNSLTADNLTIKNKYLDSTLIAAPDNFAKNGIMSPAIETQTEAAGIGYIPEGSPEVLLYNNTIKDNSLIYITSVNPFPTENLTVVKKESCDGAASDVGCKPYFKIALDKPVSNPVHFNWLVIN